MKKIAIIILFAFLSLNSFSGNGEGNKKMLSVSGTVADVQTGELLPGVKVEINQLGLSTYTDFDGKFEFEGLESGTYDISLNYISYEEKKEKVELNSSEGDINLVIKNLH